MIDPRIEEALRLLQEECSEVIKDASKICRFGFDSINPESGDTNLKSFTKEVADVACLVDILVEKGVLDHAEIQYLAELKREKLKKFSTVLDDE